MLYMNNNLQLKIYKKYIIILSLKTNLGSFLKKTDVKK